MPTRADIYQAIRNADKAGDSASVQKLGAYLNTLPPDAPTDAQDKPGMAASLGAGLGAEFGNIVLGGQKLVGKGLQKVDELVNGKGVSSLVTGKSSTTLGRAGDWLVNDATQGQANLHAENAPYAEANPLTNSAGKLGTDFIVTAPVGGIVAKGITKVAPYLGPIAPYVQRLAAATESGGMSLGGPASITKYGKVADTALRAGGGAINGAATSAVVDPDSAGVGAAIGAAAPSVLRGAGAVGRYAKNLLSVSPDVANLAEKASALGIDVPVDRLVNNKPLNALAASLEYLPFSGRAATNEKMTSQLNTALSKTFGQNSDNVTMALRKASGDLGAKFDTVLQSNTVKMTPNFKAALAEAENQATNELGPEAAAIIHKQIAQLQTKGASGAIDGQAAYNIKKALDRIGGGNSDAAFYARDLKKKLMDALNESLGPAEAQNFAKVRQQYGNMLALENLAQNGAEGGVSVGRLANLKNINNPDLQELADISAQFLKSRENPHGAMQRLVIGGAALPTAAGVGALPVLAGTVAAGRGVNAALNSNMLRQSVIKSAGRPAAQIGANESNALYNLLARTAPVALSPSGNR